MLRITLPLLLLISYNVFAHQPKLINYSPLKDNLHMVTSPEISKAYYSKLTGTPHYYQINSFIPQGKFNHSLLFRTLTHSA